MAITNAAIAGLQLPLQVRQVLIKINDTTAAALDIKACIASPEEKLAMLDVLASTATRVDINAYSIDLHLKTALLGIAGV